MTAKRIAHKIREGNRFLVVSHAHPDGDALGSTYAVGQMLNILGKEAVLVNESPIPESFMFISDNLKISNKLPAVEDFDAVILVDCGDLHRVGKIDAQIKEAPFLISIDHHISNGGFGDISWVDGAACSTCEMLVALSAELEISMTPALATALYTGMFTDTGGFIFSNTTAETLSICADLARCGADPHTVAKNVNEPWPIGRLNLFNRVLGAIEFSADKSVSLLYVTQQMLDETGTDSFDVKNMVNYAVNLRGVKMAVLIQEIKTATGEVLYGQHRVSLRSNGLVDVAQVAATHGGGGHSRAAGFSTTKKLDILKNTLFSI